MNLRIRQSICCAAAIAAIPCSAHAVATPWEFTSVRSERGGKTGAIGNGTTDDTDAINRTLAAGTVIYFPPGKYRYIGSLTLPLSNTAYRLYGDGPGISTIVFEGNPSVGINAPNMENKTLQVEGLTLQANTDCSTGTALYANFDEGAGNPNTKYRTATIRNVEIMGSARGQNPAGYWANGISLFRAQNALVEDVQVHGRYSGATLGPDASVGIKWAGSFPPPNYGTTQAFLHHIYVANFKVGVQADGWVEGFFMSQFELFFCGNPGASSHAALELTGHDPSAASPVFHVSDGHINQISCGIRMTNIGSLNISRVNFFNQYQDGTHITLTNCGGANVNDNEFSDLHVSGETQSNGIYLINSRGIRMRGNTFGHMFTPGVNGSCIVVDQNCRTVKILDSIFGDTEVLHKYNVDPASGTYIRDIP